LLFALCSLLFASRFNVRCWMLNVRCSGTAPASGAGNGALAVASAAPEGSGTADHTDYANIFIRGIRGFILCAGLLEMLVGEGADQSSRGGCAPRSPLPAVDLCPSVFICGCFGYRLDQHDSKKIFRNSERNSLHRYRIKCINLAFTGHSDS